MKRIDYGRGIRFLVAVQFLQATVLASAIPLRDLPERVRPPVPSSTGGAACSPRTAQLPGDLREAIPSLLRKLVPGDDGDVAMKRGSQQTVSLLDGGLDLSVMTLEIGAPRPETPDPFARRQAPNPTPIVSSAPDPRASAGHPAAPMEPTAPRFTTRAWDWSYRLEQVSAGSETVYHASAMPHAEYWESGSYVIYPRTPFLYEVYEPRSGGVEQSFVLLQGPERHGDLVLTGQVDSELVPRTPVGDSQGLVYEDRETHGAIVTYGAVTVVDSAGRRTSALTTAETGMLKTHCRQLNPTRPAA